MKNQKTAVTGSINIFSPRFASVPPTKTIFTNFYHFLPFFTTFTTLPLYRYCTYPHFPIIAFQTTSVAACQPTFGIPSPLGSLIATRTSKDCRREAIYSYQSSGEIQKKPVSSPLQPLPLFSTSKRLQITIFRRIIVPMTPKLHCRSSTINS